VAPSIVIHLNREPTNKDVKWVDKFGGHFVGCSSVSPIELSSRLERTKLSARDIRALTHDLEFQTIADRDFQLFSSEIAPRSSAGLTSTGTIPRVCTKLASATSRNSPSLHATSPIDVKQMQHSWPSSCPSQTRALNPWLTYIQLGVLCQKYHRGLQNFGAHERR
jgi:hypothetical protein